MNILKFEDIKSKKGFELYDFTLKNEGITEDLNEILISKAKFENVSINRKKIENSTVKQSKFIDCYMRNVSFHNVDFTGSKFVNCNLEKANFRMCNLSYTEFSKCKINIEEILESLPSQTNLKISILKQLLINQTEMADSKGCYRLLIMIAEEERKDYRNKFAKQTSYYKDLTVLERLSAFKKYIFHSFNYFIWGYGLRINRLIISAILNILIFATIFTLFPITFSDKADSYHVRNLTFIESIFQSISLFTSNGYGELVPYGVVSSCLVALESTMGLVFLGFLVSAIYRRISK